MFKRIVKIVGLVILGFVLLIGGVIGFMAIRGEFEKKVIKPKDVEFTITKTDLTFDASLLGGQNLSNEQIFTFTIVSQPANITETECLVKTSATNSKLITFVEFKDGEWVERKSKTFHLNTPIYFRLNDISEEYDGTIQITVTDKADLIFKNLELNIDRKVTSISFKDQGLGETNISNNTITNGLFGYESGYNCDAVQYLEAVEGEDYPLEVITAPVKASKPFAGREEKEHQIYFVENNQPYPLLYIEDSKPQNQFKTVKIGMYNQTTGEIEARKDCDFLKYDSIAKRYIFNSATSGRYEFMLATYPTYAVRDRLINDNTLSYLDKLKEMTTKTSVITVVGSDAESIIFNGDKGQIVTSLLQDNKWIVKDDTTLDMYDLGLTLSKVNGKNETEIAGRYNELQFLKNTHFLNNVSWKFKQTESLGNAEDININFHRDRYNNIKASISGLDTNNINNNVDYEVELGNPAGQSGYALTLKNETKHENGSVAVRTLINFSLVADEVSGKVLYLVENEEEQTRVVINVTEYDDNGNTLETYTPEFYLDLQVGSCFILDKQLENGKYLFKTLDTGLYLTLLGYNEQEKAYQVINDKFITTIDYNNASTIINVKPIFADLSGMDIRLYAIVVNADGSWTCTKTYRDVVVNEVTTNINLVEDKLSLPIIVGESMDFGTGYDVEDLAVVQEGGSYNQILMFAPKYTLLTGDKTPTGWGNGLTVYEIVAGVYTPIVTTKDTEWISSRYYTKNNYKTIDMISFEQGGTEYFLLGYIENNRFVNKIVPTGANYYSKLYPVLVRTKYLTEYNRLQYAEEYINELISGKQGEYGDITYDLSLLPGTRITKNPDCYIGASTTYDKNKKYYTFDGFEYTLADNISNNTIINWINEYQNYYEAVGAVKAVEVLGDVTKDNINNINIYINYYTKNGELLTPVNVSVGSEEFVENWEDYYIIISHYIIKEVEVDGIEINVTANAVSNGIELKNISQNFKINAIDYSNTCNDKFVVNWAKIYGISDVNSIEATSYYNFNNSSIKPTVNFGGDYFEHSETINNGVYNIIAGHKEIGLGWDGTSNNAINEKVATAYIYVNNAYNESILNDIISRLQINAKEYDAEDRFVSAVGDKITIKDITIDYAKASNVFNPNMTYYDANKVGGIITDSTIITNWAERYLDYTVKAICVEFEVSETLPEGHYVKFEWLYNYGSYEFRTETPKLVILSREVTGYTIDVGNKVYTASKITQEEEPEYYYAYNESDDKFIKVDETNKHTYSYEPGVYYSMSQTEYTDEICYQLEISYENGYVYNVYAVTVNGDKLYYQSGTSEYLVKKSEGASAFRLKTEGGWIRPEPFYSTMEDYTIQDNNYLKFEMEDQNGQTKLKISSAQITKNSFVNIELQSIDASVKKTIKVKITDEYENFKIDLDNFVNSTKEMTYSVPQNTYTYNGQSIDSKMQINVTSFSIERIGQSVTDKYELENNQIKDKVSGEVVAEVKYDVNDKQWKIVRNIYDNITLELEFKTILVTQNKQFRFESPYTIIPSNTNKTTTIYSGTNFVLASVVNEEALFKIESNNSSSIVIGYKIKNENKTITITESNWAFVVPEVSEVTALEFEIKYNNTKVDSFTLTVSPNYIITAEIEEAISLNDLNNAEFGFDALKIMRYNNALTYYSYSDEALVPVDITSINPSYSYLTYLDENHTQQYTTNIVEVVDNTLHVISPISEIDRYYVKVNLTKDYVVIGEVLFEIDAKSEIVNSSNQEIDPIKLVATEDKIYSLDDLKTIFNLSRGGDIYYVSEYIDGRKNYILNDTTGEYEEALSKEDDVVYYAKAELTDILWFDTNNEHLNITYNYNNATLIQNMNTIKYNNMVYKLIGTTYNMENGRSFDIVNNKFIIPQEEGETLQVLAESYGDNIMHTLVDNHSVIYCKQNAYLFVNEGNDNDILAVSIDSNGKNVYKFSKRVDNHNFVGPTKINSGNCYVLDGQTGIYTLVSSTHQGGNYYKLNIYPTNLGTINNITFNYNSYGKDLATNTEYVDAIYYGVELVFDNKNIKTDEKYDIYVEPYILKPSTDIMLSGTEYVLYDTENASNTDLFDLTDNEKVSKISFKTIDDGYTISSYSNSKKQTIKFDAINNQYSTKVRVQLTYQSGETYSYDIEFKVLNQTVVSITYPFNIDDKTLTGYNVFNASIVDLSKSIEDKYDINDFAQWLGVDTSVDDWESQVRIKYDILLKEIITNNGSETGGNLTTINLINDKLLEMDRYATYTRIDLSDNYEQGKYYKYNTQTNSYEIVTDEQQPEDWNGLNYFSKDESPKAIKKVEIVAVSGTYANVWQAITENITANGSNILISSSLKAEYLSKPGYIAFKVYAGDTGAYGYYILKIVADELFNNVIVQNGRNTEPVTYTITDNDTKIIDVVDADANKIYNVANNISKDLIDTDRKNVYLFMISSENVQGAIADIKPGQLIPNNTTFTTSNTVQTITLAVVVQNGTSLVHVCNYKLILQPDVEISYNEDVIVLENQDYYNYRIKDAITYNYDVENVVDLSGYFEVTKNAETKALNLIEFAKNNHSNGLVVENQKLKLGDMDIAQIDANKVTLTNPIGEDVYFYLKLTYEGGFVINLKVLVDGFEFKPETQFVVGQFNGTSFENSLDLAEVFGGYNKDYTLQYSSNAINWNDSFTDVSKQDNLLTFTTRKNDYTVYIKVILNNIATSGNYEISRIITVNVKANIDGKYNEANQGYSQTGTRVTPDVVIPEEGDNLTIIGSALNITINEAKTTIKVQNIDKNTSINYLTLNVGSFKSINFTLTGDGGETLRPEAQYANNYQYFVKDNALYETMTFEESGILSFVHSAVNSKLRLNIEVILTDGSAYATTYVLYIELPKTYELESNYRVAGATYETKTINSELLLRQLSEEEKNENQNIDKHFFGTGEDVEGLVYASRIAIDVNETKYYGYDNIVGLGLLMDNNPNKLMFNLQAPEGVNVSSINSGKLTFRSDGDAPTNILTLSNTTATIEYKFIVLDENVDYSKVEYNNNLIQIDDNGDKIVDDISIEYSKLDKGIDFAYLQYYPTNEIEGMVAYVGFIEQDTQTGHKPSCKIEQEVSNPNYSSRIVLDKGTLELDKTYRFKVKIITINGVSSEIDLIVSNFEVEYGYGEPVLNYETAYAGTQIGKIFDKYSNETNRVSAKVNGIEITNGNLEYIGALNQLVDHIYLDTVITYPSTNTSLAWYDADTQIIQSRDVAKSTPVTLIFDVKDGDLIVGRLYYNLVLENNIKIGINPNLESQYMVDLYLGSNIYDLGNSNDKTDKTTIDLLQSEGVIGGETYYNNLFVTLEKYSTGETIEYKQALYNGKDSTLLPEDVSKYLKFSVSDIYRFDKPLDKDNPYVQVDNNGKLTIKGNPTGSFTLNVVTTNKSAYGESFVINVYPYDNTTAQYGNQINKGTGVGFVSGTTIDFFKDLGQASEDNRNIGNYAFATYRQGYGQPKNTINSIFADDTNDAVTDKLLTVSYKLLTFDYNTTVNDIKLSSKWDNASVTNILPGNAPEPDPDNPNVVNNNEDNRYLGEGGFALSLTLPSVKMSTDNTASYEIVSIRMTITYKGDESVYFAHYLVYNPAKITLNESYNNKIITYGANAWPKFEDGVSDGKTIILMGDLGLYSLDATLLETQPSDWVGGKYFKYNESDKIYEPITGDATNFEGLCYKLNDIATNPDKYEIYVKIGDINRKITNVTFNGVNLVGTLPYFEEGESDYLFTNTAEIKLVFKAVEGGSILLEDNWTITAENPITPNKEMKLNQFFLTGEIGNQQYYNVSIIGLLTGDSYTNNSADVIKDVIKQSLANYVQNASDISECRCVYTIEIDNKVYYLYNIIFNGVVDANGVFKVEKDYYILVGNISNLIVFNFNGGDYYIDLTIDDNDINITNNTATFDLKGFIRVYNNALSLIEEPTISITATSGLVDIDGTTITLKNITSLTSSESIKVTVTDGNTSRTIELLFNIIINAKEKDSSGATVYNKENGLFVYNEVVIKSFNINNEKVNSVEKVNGVDTNVVILSADKIDEDINFKKLLLNLIRYNDEDVATDSKTLSYYQIEMKLYENSATYEIKYTYNDGTATYIRTFKMNKSV